MLWTIGVVFSGSVPNLSGCIALPKNYNMRLVLYPITLGNRVHPEKANRKKSDSDFALRKTAGFLGVEFFLQIYFQIHAFDKNDLWHDRNITNNILNCW